MNGKAGDYGYVDIARFPEAVQREAETAFVRIVDCLLIDSPNIARGHGILIALTETLALGLHRAVRTGHLSKDDARSLRDSISSAITDALLGLGSESKQ